MTPQQRSPTHDLAALAQGILQRVRCLFDQAVAALAEACAIDGKLDAARLDEWQFASYEIAVASADLLAAETVVGSSEPGGSDPELDERLALAFAAEAVDAVLGRLKTVFLETGLDAGELYALDAGAELARLRRSAMSRSTSRTPSRKTHSGASRRTWSRRWPGRSTATT